jgi:hypothetical protein
MRRSSVILILLVLSYLLPGETARAQSDSLQPGIPIERKIAQGQAHSFSVALEQDQFLQLVVDQHGIDLVVRVFSPTGKRLGEFDSPNGDEGPEDVSLVAATAGVYRIEVTPLGQFENIPAGRYDIKIVELRRATEQELQSGKNMEVLKAKGLALVLEIVETIPQIRRPQTRAQVQLQAAQLLWTSDEKRAAKLAAEASQGVKEFVASIDIGDQDYYQSYQMAMQLRREVLQVLTPHDPEMALGFLRSTRTLINPEGGRNNDQQNEELQLELSIANQVVATDPKRAFQMAEDSLKKGYPSSLIEIISRLRTTDPEAATRLAQDIASKLGTEKLLQNPAAVNLAVNLLRLVRVPARRNQADGGSAPAANLALLSEQQYQDLFRKTLAEGLSYSVPATNSYSPERNSAQNILTSLKFMTSDMESFAPGSIAAVEKKTIELNTAGDPRNALWQQYQNAINSGSVDAALEAAGQAPREMREQLYQQVAGKAAAAGDFGRAKQILTDHISNLSQRQQAFKNLEQQAIYAAIAKGKIDEALRLLSNFRSSRERAMMLRQIVNQIGPGQKKAAALAFLEQARSMIGVALQAEDQEQMGALLEIGRAFSRYDSKRGFEVVEPLIDQFNEISTAAITLNGFGQEYYQDGELIMNNGNNVANTANQIAQTLAAMALSNFDRAKAAADRVRPPEARLQAYLNIAQQAIQEAK